MDNVLVVGARTTGLMLAIELARRGIPLRIVDRSPGIDPHVRANLVHSRTLEILQGLGLAAAATQGSIAERGIRIYVDGALVGESLHAPLDSIFPFGMSQSQAHTEAVLESHLAKLGTRVERSVELVGLRDDGQCVEATLVDAEGRETRFEAAWLVGCDGAHSSVRHLTGTRFPGDPDPHAYLLADVELEGAIEDGEGHVFFHDDGELFVFSDLPEGRRLIAANLPPGEAPDRDPTLEEIQSIVTTRGRPDLRVRDPRWLTHFRIHYRLAPHYRKGRVFLAGDAAHVHSLIAGQGMNTGIQDAFNLGWKLALVIRGRAPETWLDSYEIERRQVGEAVVAMTRAATEEAELFAGLSTREREKLVTHMFVPESERLAAARHLQEVDLDYRSSPLSFEPEGEFVAGPHAGAQAPDAWPIELEGETTRLYEIPFGTSHRLFLFAGTGAEVATADALSTAACRAVEEVGAWIDVFVVLVGDAGEPEGLPAGARTIGDRKGEMHARYAAELPALYLVRPDGYVAYRSRRLDDLGRYLACVS